MKFIPKEILTGRMQHAMFTKEKVEARMERGSERGDFMSGVLRHNEKEVSVFPCSPMKRFTDDHDDDDRLE